jgi:hypothetical protein
MSAPFAVNPAAEVTLRRLGREGVPLLIIDEVLADPEGLRALAAATPFTEPVSPWYPGVNAPMPDAYLASLLPVLRPSLQRAFGLSDEARLATMSFLALSTRRSDELAPRQRIPHYDQPDPGVLAMVHYLGHDQGGGTGFFRHEATGFETITPPRRDAYLLMVDAELETHGAALTGFAGPDTPGYRLTEAVEARCNRLIVYPACVLHCALFEGARLDADPLTGRLTANSFLKAI